jgi:hypothetical protein
MLRCVLAAVAILMVCALSPGFADDKDGQTDNPLYKGWANFKPGSKVVIKEKTEFGDGTVEEKTVEYRLVTVTAKRATVQTSVVEKALLRIIETAPTRIIYPAKVKAADLKAALEQLDAKRSKETIKVLGKDLECEKFEGTHKTKDEQVAIATWRNSTVPGGIVKRVRTTKAANGKLIATTTTTLESYRSGPPRSKSKEKIKKAD